MTGCSPFKSGAPEGSAEYVVGSMLLIPVNIVTCVVFTCEGWDRK